MTTTAQAATFVIDTIKIAKTSMIENGADAQMICAICKKLSVMLDLPFELVVDILEVV